MPNESVSAESDFFGPDEGAFWGRKPDGNTKISGVASNVVAEALRVARLPEASEQLAGEISRLSYDAYREFAEIIRPLYGKGESKQDPTAVNARIIALLGSSKQEDIKRITPFVQKYISLSGENNISNLVMLTRTSYKWGINAVDPDNATASLTVANGRKVLVKVGGIEVLRVENLSGKLMLTPSSTNPRERISGRILTDGKTYILGRLGSISSNEFGGLISNPDVEFYRGVDAQTVSKAGLGIMAIGSQLYVYDRLMKNPIELTYEWGHANSNDADTDNSGVLHFGDESVG